MYFAVVGGNDVVPKSSPTKVSNDPFTKWHVLSKQKSLFASLMSRRRRESDNDVRLENAEDSVRSLSVRVQEQDHTVHGLQLYLSRTVQQKEQLEVLCLSTQRVLLHALLRDKICDPQNVEEIVKRVGSKHLHKALDVSIRVGKRQKLL